MYFNPMFGNFASSGYGDISEFGAAKKRKKPRKIGVLRAWKRKNGISRTTRAKAVLVKKSKDGKTCEVQLTFANPKGGSDLVFKQVLKKSPFRPFAKLCKKCAAGSTYTGGASEAASANSEAESTEDAAVENGEVEASGEESDDGDMGGFGGFWQPPQYRANPGMFGAAPKGRALRYNRTQAVSKFKRFADEDARLKVAFDTHNTKLATKTFARLARLRDHFYKKAALAAQGKATGQVTGRVLLGLATYGLSELVRATGALKGMEGKDRAKRAEHFLALGDACEAIFRYWKGKFGENHKTRAKTMPALDVAKIRALSVPGKSFDMPTGEGEEVSSIASGISEEGAHKQGVPFFGSYGAFGAAPKGRRGKMHVGQEVQSGVPQQESEFSWQGVGAIALGALGGLLIAPVVVR